jgi:hypothetical protein
MTLHPNPVEDDPVAAVLNDDANDPGTACVTNDPPGGLECGFVGRRRDAIVSAGTCLRSSCRTGRDE